VQFTLLAASGMIGNQRLEHSGEPRGKSFGSDTLVWKVMALGAGIGLAMLSYPVHAAPASGGDTVQGLYEALLATMKTGRILGQSGRFAQLEPVIRRTFDIPAMARLSVGPSWAGVASPRAGTPTRGGCHAAPTLRLAQPA
jgi:hypothetical protein